MANISEDKPVAGRGQKKHWAIFVFLLCAVGVLGYYNYQVRVPVSKLQPPPRTESKPTFSGSTDALKHTLVVPAPEAALEAGKSAIWCATLGMAWKEFEKNVAGGPVVVQGMEDVSRWLTNSKDVQLDPEHYFIAAGWNRDGFLERLQKDLLKRFPNAEPPKWKTPPPGPQAVAFAYLEVAIRYEFEFNDSDEPVIFHDSGGRKTPVQAFGIRTKDKDKGSESYRKQVTVLFQKDKEFALDLSRKSEPYQIIVARIDRNETLKETWENLARRIQKGPEKTLSDDAVVLVPNMHWRVVHEFRELEHKPIGPPLGGYFEQVSQYIRFKMDRKGATISSGATLEWNNGHVHDPNHYLFDRPYLIVLKNRKTDHPFFLMWVDNAELLERKP